MNSPLFFTRIAMLIAIAGVVGFVGWIFYMENQRKSDSKNDEQVVETDNQRSVADLLENGTVDELLIRVNQIANVPKEASYIYRATQIGEKADLYQALIERGNELSEERRELAERGLISSLLQLHTANLDEEVEDLELRSRLMQTARHLINSGSEAVSKDAHISLTAVSVLETLDALQADEELPAAKAAVADLLRRYPNDMESVSALYALLMGFGIDRYAYDSALTLFRQLNDHCRTSTEEQIRETGLAYEGRVKMVELGVIRLDGTIDFFDGDEPDELLAKIEEFLDSDVAMTPPVATIIVAIGTQMEKWYYNEAASKVYTMIKSRLAGESNFETLELACDYGIKRLGLKGNRVDIPELEPGVLTIVMFINDTSQSIDTFRVIADMRAVNKQKQFKLVLVALGEEKKVLDQTVSEYQYTGIKIVHDLDRDSIYYKQFPAKFLPSLFLARGDGVVVDSNVNLRNLEQFLKGVAQIR